MYHDGGLPLHRAIRGRLRCYLHGVSKGPGRVGDGQGGGPTGGRPSASGVPEPRLTELRMSEILGAGAEQTHMNTGGQNMREGSLQTESQAG